MGETRKRKGGGGDDEEEEEEESCSRNDDAKAKEFALFCFFGATMRGNGHESYYFMISTTSVSSS